MNITLKKVFIILFLICISSFCFALQPRVEFDKGELFINGVLAVKFRSSDGQMNPEQRAQQAALMLIELSGEYLTPESISYKKISDTQYAIVCRNSSIMSVIHSDALNLNSTVEGLCKVWIKNIRDALSVQPLYMDVSKSIIPYGENRTFKLKGSFTDVPTFQVENPDILDVNYNSQTKSILISGKNLGTSNVKISANGFFFDLLVEVKKYAAQIPNSIKLQITGNPTSSSIIRSYIKLEAMRNVNLESGASVVVQDVVWQDKALYVNQKSSATVKITAQGSTYISITKNMTVNIENVNIKKDIPKTLLYSNHPETMEKFQDLFTGHTEVGEATRLLYHHLNATGRSATLTIEIINPNDTPVIIRSTKACAKPMLDTIAIGLVAAKNFMSQDEQNISVFETVPAKSKICVLSDDLDNKISSSGIMQFAQQNGAENCIVRVRLSPKGTAGIKLNESQAYTGTGAFDFSEYIFLNPQKIFNETFVCGKNWVFISMGKEHLQTEKGVKLYGNYGVDYEMNLLLENPMEKSQKVKIAFDPTAGSTAAYFTVNGSPVTIHHIKPPNEYILSAITLAPGETKKVKIKSVPVSGSNYPVKIVVGLEG